MHSHSDVTAGAERAGAPACAIHLYFYTDSVGFPRLRDQSLEQTWPFLLAEMLRAHTGAPVFPCLRGLGGGSITEINRIFVRDTGYFRAQAPSTRSVAIFNIGVVDAAPQPFTYCLRHMVRIPRIGPFVWTRLQRLLAPHRAILQRIASYRRTSPARFTRIFARMLRQAAHSGMEVISIDTPLTPLALERRSPGLRAGIAHYNGLKHQSTNGRHLPMEWVDERHYLECGHHLNADGHRQLAQKLFETLQHMPAALPAGTTSSDHSKNHQTKASA